MKNKLCNCNIQSEGLGQPHAESMVVRLVSVSPNEPRLVDSLGFLFFFFKFRNKFDISSDFKGILWLKIRKFEGSSSLS